MSKILKKILLDTLVLVTIAILLIVIQVFVFWFMFGEGASSGRIADIWYVNFILEYLPLVAVIGFLTFKTFGRVKKKESYLVKAKVNYRLYKLLFYSLRGIRLNHVSEIKASR